MDIAFYYYFTETSFSKGLIETTF